MIFLQRLQVQFFQDFFQTLTEYAVTMLKTLIPSIDHIKFAIAITGNRCPPRFDGADGFHHALKLRLLHDLILHQILRNEVELIHIGTEKLFRSSVSLEDDLLDLSIDLCGSLLGVGLGLRHGAADEDLTALVAVGDSTQIFAHAVFGDHGAGDLGDGPAGVV